MKYLIASDIHGSLYATKSILNEYLNGNYDKLILLGDIYYHGPRNPFPKDYNPLEVANLLNKVKNLIVIKGNCDSEVDQMVSTFRFRNKYIENIEGKIFLFSHGHKNNFEKPPKDNFDIMFYGHFHVPFIKRNDIGKLFVNPGSISLPKDGNNLSFAIIDNEQIIIKDLNNNILFEEKYR